MLIKLFDINYVCIGILAGADFTLTQKNYDFDSFSATGKYIGGSDITKDAKMFMICEDDGSPMPDPASSDVDSSATASGLVRQAERKSAGSSEYSITGDDFRKILDTEAKIDYSGFSPLGTFDFFNVATNAPKQIANSTKIMFVGWGVTSWDSSHSMPTNFSGKVLYKNVWSLIKTYLSYFSLSVRMYMKTGFSDIYNTSANAERPQASAVSVNLGDFISDLSSFANTTNCAVPYVNDSTSLAPWYLYRSGNISKTAPTGEEIMWPIQSVFEQDDDLVSANEKCLEALADARFQQSIVISDSDKHAPINLSNYPLGQWFKCYYNDGTYQYLPLSERTVVCKNGILSYKVKLGNKKSFLTDFIRK